MDSIHTFQLNDRSLAWCWSHGPTEHPLVVLHGLGDSSIHTFAPRFAASVLQNTPTLFIDLPGFGEGTASDQYPATIELMADDVRALLSSLDVTAAPVIGHSMGANIAIVLASRYPALVSKLIVAEPLLAPEHSVLAAGIAKHGEHQHVDRRHAMLIRATEIQASRGDEVAIAYLTTVKMANPLIMHRAATSLLSARNPDFISMLSSLQCPRTLLMGEKTQANIPSAIDQEIFIYRVKGSGHSMHIEQPERFSCAILKVVSQAV